MQAFQAYNRTSSCSPGIDQTLACTLSPLPKFSPARDIIIVIIYLCSHLLPVGKKIANLCRNLPRHAISK